MESSRSSDTDDYLGEVSASKETLFKWCMFWWLIKDNMEYMQNMWNYAHEIFRFLFQKNLKGKNEIISQMIVTKFSEK